MPQQPHAGGKNCVLSQRAQRAFRKCWCFYAAAKMVIWLLQFCACLVETREKGSGTLSSADRGQRLLAAADAAAANCSFEQL